MNALINKGGPAFPQPDTISEGTTEIQGDSGMTLRDYFAAKAMQGLLHESHSWDGKWHMEANAAFAIADAMIQARSV